MAKRMSDVRSEAVMEALKKPTISPDELHSLKVLPLSRGGIYDACNRGEIECVRYGKKIAIVTAALRRELGLEAA